MKKLSKSECLQLALKHGLPRAMFLESRNWEKGRGPRLPVNVTVAGTTDAVLKRWDEIIDVLSQHNGLERRELKKWVPDLTDHDLCTLCSEGRISKSTTGHSWRYLYYGPQAMAAE